LAIIPYIGLQIKAISDTFHLVTKTENPIIFLQIQQLTLVLIAIFSSYYGTRYVDASEKRLGIISAVAVESFLKLSFSSFLEFLLPTEFSMVLKIFMKKQNLPDFTKRNSLTV
jgi:Na+/proline symporter